MKYSALLIGAVVLTGCTALYDGRPREPSYAPVTAGRLLAFADTYLSTSTDTRPEFFRAVEREYTENPNAANSMRLAILLVLPGVPNNNPHRAGELLDAVREKPWSVSPDTLHLARLLREMASAQEALAEILTHHSQQLEQSEAEIDNLNAKIEALTNIEQTVESPVKTDDE